MAEFKWKKGRKPKEDGTYLITVKDGDEYFVFTDYYRDKWDWEEYCTDEILAYAPLPSPFRPRRRKNG